MKLKLKEAIEILEQERNDHHFFPTDIIGVAESLGIEAIKVLRHGRLIGSHHDPVLLPGETKE